MALHSTISRKMLTTSSLEDSTELDSLLDKFFEWLSSEKYNDINRQDFILNNEKEEDTATVRLPTETTTSQSDSSLKETSESQSSTFSQRTPVSQPSNPFSQTDQVNSAEENNSIKKSLELIKKFCKVRPDICQKYKEPTKNNGDKIPSLMPTCMPIMFSTAAPTLIPTVQLEYTTHPNDVFELRDLITRQDEVLIQLLNRGDLENETANLLHAINWFILERLNNLGYLNISQLEIKAFRMFSQIEKIVIDNPKAISSSIRFAKENRDKILSLLNDTENTISNDYSAIASYFNSIFNISSTSAALNRDTASSTSAHAILTESAPRFKAKASSSSTAFTTLIYLVFSFASAIAFIKIVYNMLSNNTEGQAFLEDSKSNSESMPLQKSDKNYDTMERGENSKTSDADENNQANNKNGCVFMSIDAMMEPEHVRLQNEAFARFGEDLFGYNFLTENQVGTVIPVTKPMNQIANTPTEPSHAADSIHPSTSNNNLMISLLSAQQVVEYLPIINYIAQGFNITLPKILDNKPMLITSHLVLGNAAAALLPYESIANGMITSSIATGSYAIRLVSAGYLTEQRQEALAQDEPMSSFEMAKYCGASMFAYTLPSLGKCAVTKWFIPEAECSFTGYDLSISASLAGTDCYAVYKAASESTTPTAADVVIPYIVDAIAFAMTSQYLTLDMSSAAMAMQSVKQCISVVSTVVTTDYMSRLVMDMMPIEVKIEQIDPLLNYIANACESTAHNINYTIGVVNEYFAQNNEL